jgi:hypothetical protein
VSYSIGFNGLLGPMAAPNDCQWIAKRPFDS